MAVYWHGRSSRQCRSLWPDRRPQMDAEIRQVLWRRSWQGDNHGGERRSCKCSPPHARPSSQRFVCEWLRCKMKILIVMIWTWRSFPGRNCGIRIHANGLGPGSGLEEIRDEDCRIRWMSTGTLSGSAPLLENGECDHIEKSPEAVFRKFMLINWLL